jgi:hypothetical protein
MNSNLRRKAGPLIPDFYSSAAVNARQILCCQTTLAALKEKVKLKRLGLKPIGPEGEEQKYIHYRAGLFTEGC